MAADRLCVAATATGNFSNTASTTVRLAVGDIIRAHTDGAPIGSPIVSQFTITRVS